MNGLLLPRIMAALAIEPIPNILKIGKTDVRRFANLGCSKIVSIRLLDRNRSAVIGPRDSLDHKQKVSVVDKLEDTRCVYGKFRVARYPTTVRSQELP